MTKPCDDDVTPRLVGVMHYWRAPRHRWEVLLRKMRGLSFDTVHTAIPWNAHETSFRRLDFGQHDTRKGLRDFVELADSVGLRVTMDLGPSVGAQLPYGGVPERIVFDRACQARDPRQRAVLVGAPPNLYPLPSYASVLFEEEVCFFHQQVVKELDGLLRAQGSRPPVVARIHLDASNELKAYRDLVDCDYHPDAIKAWVAFLGERYGTLDALRRAHDALYEDWSEATPSTERGRQRSGPGKHHAHPQLLIDWAEHHERLERDAFLRFRTNLLEQGAQPDAFALKTYTDSSLWMSIHPDLRKAPIVVETRDHRAPQNPHAWERTAGQLRGSTKVSHHSVVRVGGAPWHTLRDTRAALYSALTSAGHGAASLGFEMAVDRNQWLGALIQESGALGMTAGHWNKTLAAAVEAGLPGRRQPVEVAIAVPAEYRRLSRSRTALNAFGPALQSIFGFDLESLLAQGERDAPRSDAELLPYAWRLHVGRLSDALRQYGIAHLFLEPGHDVSCEGLKLVIAPVYGFIDPTTWNSLEAMSAKGIHVAYGPNTPKKTTSLAPLEVTSLSNGRQVNLDTPAQIDRVVSQWQKELGLRRSATSSREDVEILLLGDADSPDAMVVLHHGRARRTCTLAAQGIEADLVDAVTGERLEMHGSAEIDMEPMSVRILQMSCHPREPRSNAPRVRRDVI